MHFYMHVIVLNSHMWLLEFGLLGHHSSFSTPQKHITNLLIFQTAHISSYLPTCPISCHHHLHIPSFSIFFYLIFTWFYSFCLCSFILFYSFFLPLFLLFLSLVFVNHLKSVRNFFTCTFYMHVIVLNSHMHLKQICNFFWFYLCLCPSLLLWCLFFPGGFINYSASFLVNSADKGIIVCCYLSCLCNIVN